MKKPDNPAAALRKAIADFAEQMLTAEDSVTPRKALAEMRRDPGYTELIEDQAFRLADEWVVRQFASELSGRSNRKTDTDQLALPGIGEIDRIITVSDGEGGFAYKHIQKASIADLVEDEDLMRRNRDAAAEAYERARLRNAVLIPTMEANDFTNVKDALAYLGAEAEAA